MNLDQDRERVLLDKVNAITEEGEGLIESSLVPLTFEYLAQAAERANAGDPVSCINIESIALASSAIAKNQGKHPIKCLTCETEFSCEHMPAVLVVTRAARDDAVHAIFNGVCINCVNRFDSLEKLRLEVVDIMLKVLAPGTRVLDISKEVGHA